MTIKIANNALENCTSINQVVELMKSNTGTDATAETIAAAYAIDGATEAGYGHDGANLESQLDALVEAGAEFDFQDAMAQAITSKR